MKVIFSNDIDFVSEELKYVRENSLDIFGETDVSEEDIEEYVTESINNWIQDEAYNLDKELDGRILVIADLGFWNGRRSGYKILGKKLKEILFQGDDYYSVYLKNRNVKAKSIHHDGVHHFEFREIREDRNIDVLLEDIYNGVEISRGRLNYYTKSLESKIKGIYGW